MRKDQEFITELHPGSQAQVQKDLVVQVENGLILERECDVPGV